MKYIHYTTVRLGVVNKADVEFSQNAPVFPISVYFIDLTESS